MRCGDDIEIDDVADGVGRIKRPKPQKQRSHLIAFAENEPAPQTGHHDQVTDEADLQSPVKYLLRASMPLRSIGKCGKMQSQCEDDKQTEVEDGTPLET